MLYSEIKRETLGHLNQYSIAGAPIAASYNNQADYLSRIPMLINEGVLNVRTLVKPEPIVWPLETGEDYGDMTRYELPEDFWTLKTGGVTVIRIGQFRKTNNYRLQGKKYILIPKDAEGSFTVEYYKYPNKLPLAPAEDFELEEDIEVIQAATYYAAANLVLQEDEFAYASLYNDYESRLGRITRGVTVEVQPVEDAYAFNAGWC
jgi:hypothetical protein